MRAKKIFAEIMVIPTGRCHDYYFVSMHVAKEQSVTFLLQDVTFSKLAC
jgi:hypothetical protein